jgi:hypothetical protein
MRKHPLPTPEYLHKRLRYEPSTGKLFWKACADMPRQWNTRYAGGEVCCTRNTKGYAHFKMDGRKGYLAHRVIWAMVTGKWPPTGTDHIDHDKWNNRIRNLRRADDKTNARNQKLHSTNTSGTMGVVWHARDKRWLARIHQTHIGSFGTYEEARAARKAAEIKHNYHANHGAH